MFHLLCRLGSAPSLPELCGHTISKGWFSRIDSKQELAGFFGEFVGSPDACVDFLFSTFLPKATIY